MRTTDFSELLQYEQPTGKLLWKVTRNGRGCIAGREAGTVTSAGYRAVMIDGKKLYAHRLVWELHNGPVPEGLCIDHVDGDRSNNRLENLRLATLSVNQRNAKLPKNNRLGIIGIYQKRNGFEVRCETKNIGYFSDFFEACCARRSAELRSGYHENHGRK